MLPQTWRAAARLSLTLRHNPPRGASPRSLRSGETSIIRTTGGRQRSRSQRSRCVGLSSHNLPFDRLDAKICSVFAVHVNLRLLSSVPKDPNILGMFFDRVLADHAPMHSSRQSLLHVLGRKSTRRPSPRHSVLSSPKATKSSPS